MTSGADRRAARLLRWYPPAWRERYGDEFSELLIAEFAERPRSWRRAAEIAWMAVSPLALIALVAGVAGVTGSIRRLDWSPRLLRYEAWLAGHRPCLEIGARRALSRRGSGPALV